MIKTPVRGMRDLLPSDMVVRDYLLGLIEQTAKNSGYQKIETPMMEHLENLTSNNGGENEKLIFKILKRGESLKKALAENSELTDSALRFDLTVPLSRYYAANSGKITSPFKALQIGSVWRADAPQKGRFRQFIQCDMDTLGDASILAEVDTITTVMTILSKICLDANISGLTLRINDRRILQAAADFAGFVPADYDQVFILLDKNDKIGMDGVRQEMLDDGFAPEKVEKFINLFKNLSAQSNIKDFCQSFTSESAKQAESDLEAIVASTLALGFSNVKVIFDPSLVRGMGYYTGPIFECTADGLGSSIAGGGRYDKMIGQFIGGKEVPACGFSIGFERLYTILSEANFQPNKDQVMRAILISPKIPSSQYAEILTNAATYRAKGELVSVLPMSRNLGRQISELENIGYSIFDKIYEK